MDLFLAVIIPMKKLKIQNKKEIHQLSFHNAQETDNAVGHDNTMQLWSKVFSQINTK